MSVEIGGTVPRTGEAGWPELGLTGLTRHIEEVHHRFLDLELPALISLAAKVRSAYGERHPELFEVSNLVSALRDEFVPHMAKENRVLFPAIRELDLGRHGFAFGSVANPIAVMTSEHDAVGETIGALRSCTGGFAVPDDGCRSFHRLYERLSALESDTHVHLMKENGYLFPRAVEREAELIAQSAAAAAG